MKKFYVEKNEAIPNVQYTSADLSATHDDMSGDITSIDLYWKTELQMMHARRLIKSAVVAVAGSDYSTWGNLSSDEQKIASKWICAPYALRVPTHYTDAEDKENWKRVIQHNQGWTFPDVIEGRACVIEKMREHTADQLRVENWTYADSNDFLKEVIDFMMTYIFGEDQRLIQWITNEVGSAYENAGFAQKTYFSTTLRDELVDIYNEYY